MKGNIRAHAAVIGANLIFGTSYSVVKMITPAYLPALALNAFRVITAILFFYLGYLLHPGRAWPEKKDIPRLIVCALTGIVINQLLFIKVVSLTSPIHSALLSLATPLFITGIAAWLLRETFTLLKALGLLLGLSGATLLIMLKATPGAMQNSLEGDTMVLLNAISYSFYLVLVKPLMAKYQGVDILRWLFLMGAIIILPLGLPPLIKTDYTNWSWVQWNALFFIGIGATFLAYLLNLYGINRIGAAATGSYIYTQPVFAALIASLFYGEKLSGVQIISATLIFSGVYLANYKKSVTALG